MATYIDEDRRRQDREWELEDQFRKDAIEEKRRQEVAAENERQREHELRITEIQVKGAIAPARYEAIRRVLVPLVKLPSLVILSFMLPIVAISKRPIPKCLADFITL